MHPGDEAVPFLALSGEASQLGLCGTNTCALISLHVETARLYFVSDL